MITIHCVSATTQMAVNLGYQNYIMKDAVHTFDFKDHERKTIPAQLSITHYSRYRLAKPD